MKELAVVKIRGKNIPKSLSHKCKSAKAGTNLVCFRTQGMCVRWAMLVVGDRVGGTGGVLQRRFVTQGKKSLGLSLL